MTDIPRVDLAKDVFSTDVSSRLLSDMYKWNIVDYALEEYRKTYATLHSFVIGEFLDDEMIKILKGSPDFKTDDPKWNKTSKSGQRLKQTIDSLFGALQPSEDSADPRWKYALEFFSLSNGMFDNFTILSSTKKVSDRPYGQMLAVFNKTNISNLSYPLYLLMGLELTDKSVVYFRASHVSALVKIDETKSKIPRVMYQQGSLVSIDPRVSSQDTAREMRFLMEDIVNKAIVTIPKTP